MKLSSIAWDYSPDIFRNRPPQWCKDIEKAGREIYSAYFKELEKLKQERKKQGKLKLGGEPYPHNKIVGALIDDYKGPADRERLRKLIMCRSGSLCMSWMDRASSGTPFMRG